MQYKTNVRPELSQTGDRGLLSWLTMVTCCSGMQCHCAVHHRRLVRRPHAALLHDYLRHRGGERRHRRRLHHAVGRLRQIVTHRDIQLHSSRHLRRSPCQQLRPLASTTGPEIMGRGPQSAYFVWHISIPGKSPIFHLCSR